MLLNHKDTTNYWCPMARIAAENMGTMNRHFSRRDSTDKVAPPVVFVWEICAWPEGGKTKKRELAIVALQANHNE